MAMACMYLGAKIADSPKSCRDIIYGCVSMMCSTEEQSIKLRNDSEWMKQTRQAVNDAERALLYQLGFRFSWMSAPYIVARILSDKASVMGAFLNGYFENRSTGDEITQLSSVSLHLAYCSVKVPLILQYSQEAIAAACIWMGMKMMKVTADPPMLINSKTGEVQSWYTSYGLQATDLDVIAEQITECILENAEAAHIIPDAAKVSKIEFLASDNNEPPPPPLGDGNGGTPPPPGDGNGGSL